MGRESPEEARVGEQSGDGLESMHACFASRFARTLIVCKIETSQIQFAHGNCYASVTAKSAAPSRQDVQRTDSLPSLSLSPDVCVPFRASDQMWIDTPQSRSGALTLLARLCTQTYVEKPCDLLGHYFRSGCQAKSAAKLRKNYACLTAPRL